MDAAPRPALPPGRVAEAGLLVASGALLAGAVLAGGGSRSGSLDTVGIAAIVCAAVALAAALRGVLPLPRLDRPGAAAVAALAALTAWAGLSMAWSIAGDLSWEWLARGLVYLAFLALGLLAGALGGGARRVAAVTALVIAAALGWALLGVAVPSLFPDGDRIARLREPVGYWNALALLADAGIALGLWVARDRRAGVRIAGLLARLRRRPRAAPDPVAGGGGRSGRRARAVARALRRAAGRRTPSRCGGRPGSRRRGLGVHAAGARRGRRVARGPRRRTGGSSRRWPSPGPSSSPSARGASRSGASSPSSGQAVRTALVGHLRRGGDRRLGGSRRDGREPVLLGLVAVLRRRMRERPRAPHGAVRQQPAVLVGGGPGRRSRPAGRRVGRRHVRAGAEALPGGRDAGQRAAQRPAPAARRPGRRRPRASG